MNEELSGSGSAGAASTPPALENNSASGSAGTPSEDPEHHPVEPLLSTGAGISQFQRKLLTNNWAHLNKSGPGGIGTIVFQKFLSKRPEFRVMFQKAAVLSNFSPGGTNSDSVRSLSDHVKVLTETIEFSIINLKHLELVGERCTEQGKAHSHLNMSYDCMAESPDYWDVFGQSMLEAFTQLDVVRKHKELVRAWMQLISFMVDNWRHGYLTGIKRLRLQRANTSVS